MHLIEKLCLLRAFVPDVHFQVFVVKLFSERAKLNGVHNFVNSVTQALVFLPSFVLDAERMWIVYVYYMYKSHLILDSRRRVLSHTLH